MVLVLWFRRSYQVSALSQSNIGLRDFPGQVPHVGHEGVSFGDGYRFPGVQDIKGMG
ncbi:MAG: hypothetical protein QG657_5774, partial [Acidobacteriota bacterium]|nr:hypothetical protein [Acidobacteriota bacterium]